MEMAAVLLMKS